MNAKPSPAVERQAVSQLIEHGLLPKPRSLEEAERMIAFVMASFLGGADAVDVVVRNQCRGFSQRAIAEQDKCRRSTVARRIRRFKRMCDVINKAKDAAAG